MWGFEEIYALLRKTFLKGFVKSVQSGVTAGAGTVTITAVNKSKSIILSKSKGSAGTVAATGNISSDLNIYTQGATAGTWNSNATNTTNKLGRVVGTSTLSGGTTNLTTKEYSAVLTNDITVTVDGPVEWQVLEFY